ncbi:cytochrome c1 [Helicobacter jaachi]|uniref:Cytochrome c1 n=1 Tax=Helicobacter jaachi TaxID=1677920 RepID=A0A4U8TB03_9HELI|nr:c-type cytochrome [Helicobacter jaachi]TLD96348.1 cytochrome c1 [Helicobacter jaachi]
MKELKILAILIVVVGVLYWGVEPLAHATFHPEVAKADFAFKDLQEVDISKGDAERGKALIEANCIGCHTLNDVGIAGGDMAMYFRDDKEATISTPDISTAGAIYHEKFLANLIMNPIETLHLSHKFPNFDFPMPPYAGDENQEQEVADMVAYLKSIGSVSLKKQVLESQEFVSKKERIEKANISESQKQNEIAKLEDSLTNKAVFLNACSRCHTMKYDKVASKTTPQSLGIYLGSAAPDLSTIIRSKGEHYLEYFINDPQKVSYKSIQEAIIKKQGSLPANDKKSDWQDDKDYSNLAKELGVMPVGLSMPRVGLTQESQERVVAYLESIGDSKKAERESLGVKIMIFFAVMSVLAYLWKRRIWSEVH